MLPSTIALQIGVSTASRQPVDALDQFPCSPSAFGVRLTASPKGFRRFFENSSHRRVERYIVLVRGRERGHLPANATRLVVERSDRIRPGEQ